MSEPPGAWAYTNASPNTYFGWAGGLVRTVRRDFGRHGYYWCDFAEGEDAWFVIAVDRPGTCRAVLTLGEPEQARGPVTVSTPAGVVAAAIRTKAGETRTVEFDLEPVDGRLAFRLRASECGSFAAAGVVIYGPRGLGMVPRLFEGGRMLGTIETGGLKPLPPPPAPAVTADDAGARETLRRLCDFLLQQQPSEGCFSRVGSWYESAYPCRTLLAAARLLDEPRYAAAAVECLDRFASEQLANANWPAGYFGHAGCQLATAARVDPQSANLADVGTMSVALLVAADQVDADRRQRFIEAARRYAEEYVLPNQLESGAFPNLKFAGTSYRHPYSVATGVQAASLAALGAITGEDRYQAASEAAARFLLTGFGTPGLYRFCQFNNETPTEIPFARIGDLFYVLEGLAWVRHYTADAALARDIQKALARYFWGAGGISGSRTDEALWKARDAWEASKQGGLLFLLTEYNDGQVRGLDPESSAQWALASAEWVRGFRRLMADPVRAARLGIGVNPLSSEGVYGFPATGFAGIGLAASLDRTLLFPVAGGR